MSTAHLVQRRHAKDPFRATMALSDGESVWAFRCSSDAGSPSLCDDSP